MKSQKRCLTRIIYFVFLAILGSCATLDAQQILGTITGTVKDSSGAAVPEAAVRARNIATNLEVVEHTQANGSYSVPNLPAGSYTLTFTKDGFETETHTEVLVNGDRTTTVDGSLQVGAVSTTVEAHECPVLGGRRLRRGGWRQLRVKLST